MTKQELYKAIAVVDPGNDIDKAFTYISSLTDYSHPLSGNELRIWAAKFQEDYRNLEAAASDIVDGEILVARGNVACQMCLKLFDSPNSILDLGDPDLRAMLLSFKGAGILTSSGHDALLAMATQPVFPNLKLHDLQNMRDQKAKGLI